VHELRIDERLLLGETSMLETGGPALDHPPIEQRWPMKLEVKQLDSSAQLPAYARPGDAGLDLASNVDAEVGPGERAMIPTGVAVAVPEGHAGLVLPRSGLASRQGLTLANSPGLIDAGYRGEVTCAVVNLDRDRPVQIARGDRIAQLLIVPIAWVEPVWAEELPPSERGGDGFGSTGS
jgi:dUTP pyrophosphatase